jgi:hypothetical protein
MIMMQPPPTCQQRPQLIKWKVNITFEKLHNNGHLERSAAEVVKPMSLASKRSAGEHACAHSGQSAPK